MNIKHKITLGLQEVVKEVTGLDVIPQIEAPANKSFGDYSTNIVMLVNSKFKNPMELAKQIVEEYTKKYADLIPLDIEKVEIAPPGFINFWLSKNLLISNLKKVLENKKIEESTSLQITEPGRTIVEYAHPNTHKEMHIGHLRTLVTGEALARILETNGKKVFRANYQGDIGPHVAKALYGVLKLIKEESLSLDKIEKWKNSDKAHFLGRAYALGNSDYKEHKEEIDKINSELYAPNSNDQSLKNLYLTTRKWSLDYYEELYKRFYTKFDQLFFESEMSDCGKKIVLENIGKVFEEDLGAVVFKGDKFGLHTRVFVTKQGHPTYEGKDMCLGFKQYEAFPFDLNIHVVASEQAGYFKVIFKALELLDPKKFTGTQKHLSMGMVQLSEGKMSSRTGEVLTVDWLIETIKSKVLEEFGLQVSQDSSFARPRLAGVALEKTIEQIVIGAIKYSVLKVNTQQNVSFDIKKSVSLEGDSGPYLQYTYARTCSVLAKSQIPNPKSQKEEMENEELSLLRLIYQFPEIIQASGQKLAPNIICTYLFDLAQTFNLFYQKHQIIGSEFRISLTRGVGKILQEGLGLLGIEAPERM